MNLGMWGLGVGDRRQVDLPEAPHEHVLADGALDDVQIGHEIPSNLTLAETPHYGPAAGGLGTPGSLSLMDPVTARELTDSVWALGEHARVVAQALGRAACDWHATDRVILSSTINVDGYQLKGNPVLVAGRAPARRITIYNPTGYTVDVTDTMGAAPVFSVPGGVCVVAPWNADSVVVSTATAIVADAALLVVRSDRETDEFRVFPIAPAGALLNESTGLLEAPRTMSGLGHFLAVTAAGSSPVWTPAAGLRFRVQRFTVDLTNEASVAAGGTVTIDLRDGTSAANAIGKWSVFIPTTSVVTNPGLQRIADVTLPGNGYLSQTANNPLDVNLGTALTAGFLRINAWGTEE